MCWLLSRGYPRKSSLALVGNRYCLRERQRVAINRACCSQEQIKDRLAKLVDSPVELAVDGFNLITTVEAALGGGILLHCLDSSIRDMASLHGSYKRVQETPIALQLIAQATDGCPLHWYLDRPVSNSGRLSTMILDFACREGLDWKVELVPDPDPVLKELGITVATSDSAILDAASGWCNLTSQLLELVPGPIQLIPLNELQ